MDDNRINEDVSGNAEGVDGYLARAWWLKARDPRTAYTLTQQVLTEMDGLSEAQRIRALCIMAHALINLSDYHTAMDRSRDGLALIGAQTDRGSSVHDDADAANEALQWETRLHISLATGLRRTGDPTAATEHLLRAQDLARETNDVPGICAVLNGLGYIDRAAGLYEQAIERHQEAIALARDNGLPEEEATSTLGLGNTLERFGRYNEALDLYTEALRIGDALDHRQLQAYASGNIALIHQRRGHLSEAIRYSQLSLQYKEQQGDQWGVGVSLNNLSIIYRTIGHYDAALEAAVRSLEITRTIGDKEGESVALNSIGQVYESLGDLTGVMHYYTTSLMISRDIGHFQGEAYSLLHIGRLYNTMGDQPRALIHVLRSRRLFADSGDRYGERGALTDLGYIHQKLDQRSLAQHYFQQSLEIAEELGDPVGIIDSLIALGIVCMEGGDTTPAIAHLQRALDLSVSLGATEQRRFVLDALSTLYAQLNDDERASRFRRESRNCVRELFNDESARRVREILFDFEGGHLRRQGVELGLTKDELDEVAKAANMIYRVNRSTFPAESPSHVREERTTVVAAADNDGSTPRIVITTLGSFSVVVDGRRLDAAAWGRKRAREMFKLLLTHHGRALTIDELLLALWGDEASGRNGDRLVMNAISHVRRALEPDRDKGATSRYVHIVDRTYTLDLADDGWVDFLRFKDLIVSARRATSQLDRTRLYGTAVGLYGGDFLKEEHFAHWSDNERSLLHDAYLEALEYLAAEHLRNGLVDEACVTARSILKEDPTSERGWEILILGLRERGRNAEAVQCLEDCERAFRTELDQSMPDRLRRLLNER